MWWQVNKLNNGSKQQDVIKKTEQIWFKGDTSWLVCVQAVTHCHCLGGVLLCTNAETQLTHMKSLNMHMELNVTWLNQHSFIHSQVTQVKLKESDDKTSSTISVV